MSRDGDGSTHVPVTDSISYFSQKNFNCSHSVIQLSVQNKI